MVSNGTQNMERRALKGEVKCLHELRELLKPMDAINADFEGLTSDYFVV